MSELKECPFCGGEAQLDDCRTIWRIVCIKCESLTLGDRAPEPDGTETDEFWQNIKQTAIDRWNNRTSTPDVDIQKLIESYTKSRVVCEVIISDLKQLINKDNSNG